MQNKAGIDMDILTQKSSNNRTTTPQPGSNLELALNLVEHELSIFPCEPDKKPLIVKKKGKNGKPVHLAWERGASNDPRLTERRWTLHPTAPIGIPCEMNGFFTLDLDRHGVEDGVKNFQVLAGGKEKFAPGPIQDTAGNGVHYLFATNGEDIPQLNKGEIGKGIDIKSDGYICTGTLPDGRAYSWRKGHGFDVKPPTAPTWLLEEIRKVGAVPDPVPATDTSKVMKHKKSIKKWMAQYLAQVKPEISRNDIGLALANQLRDDGYSRDEAKACEYPEKVKQFPGKPSYTRDEWEASVGSSFKQKPRGQAKKPKKESVVEPTSEPVPGEPPRFIRRDAAFFLALHPPKEFLIDRLFMNPSVNVFFGEPGSMKTYSMLHLAGCVATGQPWLGFETKQCPVLIIDEENGEIDLALRMWNILHGLGCKKSTPIFGISLADFKLDDDTDGNNGPCDLTIIREQIEETKAGLVLYDPFADLFTGDENSKEFTQPVFHNLRKIASDFHSVQVMVHHSNRAGGYRGSSAIRGAVDLMVEVKPDPNSTLINFESIKNRHGKVLKWGAEAIFEDDKFIRLEPSTGWIPPKGPGGSPAMRFVRQYLEDHGESFTKDIKSNPVDCTPKEVGRAIVTLQDKGVIKRTNPGVSDKIGAKYILVDDVDLSSRK